MNDMETIAANLRERLTTHKNHQMPSYVGAATQLYLELALEYKEVDDFVRMAVLLPKVVMGWETALYLSATEDTEELIEATDPTLKNPQYLYALPDTPREENGFYLFPLRRHLYLPPINENAPAYPLAGLLIVKPDRPLNDIDIFYLSRYAEMAGTSVARRFLSRKSSQHINFVRKLVADIGHDVIVPNIFFKAYLRRLRGKIKRLIEIQAELKAVNADVCPEISARLKDLTEEMGNANEGLQEEFEHIRKHYESTSLFLETLLRESHFQAGRYVLQKKTFNFYKDIITPQVEQYRSKLESRGIEIDISAGGVPDKTFEVVADVGLVSQVFANLLSNAVKYTRPVPGYDNGRKFIAYGMETIPDAFGQGIGGIKINLFSSGPPIPIDDAAQVFQEGFRGANIEKERGTGHGLHFVKEVIELHGGRVGYETTEQGNNFYFILPI